MNKNKYSLTRINTNQSRSINTNYNKSSEVMKTFQTVDVKNIYSGPPLSQRSIAIVSKLIEEGKESIVQKNFKVAIEKFSKGLDIDSNNLSLLFYRGISYLDYSMPNETIKDLNRILNIQPDYKKIVYLILSIAYKRVDKNKESLDVLCKGINYFPKFSDIYLARAHIYLYMRQYNHALNDFRSFSKYAHKKVAGYLGEGDALRKLGKLNEAIEWYSRIVDDLQIKTDSPNLYNSAVERRAIALFSVKKYENAKQDFEYISNTW